MKTLILTMLFIASTPQAANVDELRQLKLITQFTGMCLAYNQLVDYIDKTDQKEPGKVLIGFIEAQAIKYGSTGDDLKKYCKDMNTLSNMGWNNTLTKMNGSSAK